MKCPSQQTYLPGDESWELGSRIWTARLLHAMMRSRIMMCGSPLLLFHCVCPLKPSWILGQSDPCRHVLSAHRGVDFWGWGGERDWDFYCWRSMLFMRQLRRDRTELDSEYWQTTAREATLSFFFIVGIICGFNLNAPWLLKWLLLQVLNLYVKQRWEKFSHHVDYKTETSRTFTFT